MSKLFSCDWDLHWGAGLLASLSIGDDGPTWLLAETGCPRPGTVHASPGGCFPAGMEVDTSGPTGIQLLAVLERSACESLSILTAAPLIMSTTACTPDPVCAEGVSSTGQYAGR